MDEAIWLFTQVLEVFPESLDTLNSRALAFLDRDREGDVNFAIEDLDRAARIKPQTRIHIREPRESIPGARL